MYPDGNITSYLLQNREYRIGPETQADIRLEEGTLAGVQAILTVGHEGVYLINLGAPESILIEGSPTNGRQQLSVGNRITIGGLHLELDVASALADDAAGTSPDGTAKFRHSGWRSLLRGVGGYATLNRVLASEISPDEAAAARERFFKGKRALGNTVLGLLGIILLRVIFVPPEAYAWHEIVDDVVSGLSLLFVYGLVRFYQARFAGRLLMPVLCLEVFQVPPSSNWDNIVYEQGGMLLFALLLFFFLGWMVDYGAGREESGPPRLRRKWVLTGAGALMGSLLAFGIWFDRKEAALTGATTIVTPWFTIACSVALVILAWLPTRRHALQKDSGLTGDILTCHLVAERRWLRFLYGRIIAILVGLVPVLIFLNGLDVKEKLRWTEDRGVIRSIDEGGNEHAWFWGLKGRWLRAEDLERTLLYGWTAERFASEEEQEVLLNEVAALMGNVQNDPYDGESYAKLRQALEPYRLRDPLKVGKLLWDDSRVTLLLEQNRTRAERSAPEGKVLYHAQPMIGVNSYSQGRVEVIQQQIDAANWVSACFGLVGLLVLWRRAGDSPTARWIGFWLVGAVCGYQALFGEVFSENTNYQIWHQALVSPFSNLLLAFWAGSQIIQNMIIGLNFLSIPLCAAWVHLCWPVRQNSGGGTWKVRGWIVLRILAVVAAVNVVSYVIGYFAAMIMPKTAPLSWAVIPGSVVITLLFVGVGWALRRRTRLWTEAPKGGLLLPACFVLSQIAAWFSLVMIDSYQMVSQVSLATKSFACLFLICSLVFIVRKMFLRIPAERDIGVVLLTLLLPFVFEILENVSQNLLSQTPFFSETGASILGLVLVVLVLGPLWSIIGRVIAALTVRRFGKVQKTVSLFMKEVLEGEQKSDFRETSLDMFQELGIKEFVFYRRSANGEGYEMTLRGGGATPAERIKISKMLRERLAQGSSFVDADGIVFEWTYFFEQFEMRRLRNATGCRYFLPIGIGGCLRGILALPDNEQSKELSRFAVAPKLTEFGLSLFVGGKV